MLRLRVGAGKSRTGLASVKLLSPMAFEDYIRRLG
jgi:hypothetical protein